MALVRYQPDVIVTEGASNFANNIQVFLYRRIFRIRVVWWSLGLLNESRAGRLGKLLRRAIYLGESGCDAVLTYSSSGADYFRRRGYAEDRVVIGYNCIDESIELKDLPQARVAAGKLRAQYCCNGEPMILSVGALTKVKRPRVLCEAFLSLEVKTPNEPQLVVVGDGPERSALELEYGGHERIHFAGPVIDGVSAYFEAADLFVLPGLGGLALSQACVHGLPIICGPADGTEADYVLDGVNGRLLPQVTPSSLGLAMKDLLSDKDKLARMGVRSRKLVDDRSLNMESYEQSFIDAVSAATGERITVQ